MPGLDRRSFLRAGVGAAVVGAAGSAGARPAFAAPAVVRRGRPELTSGVQSGDVSAHAATVWARSDRPARMLVEVDTRASFHHPRLLRGPVVTPETDLAGKVRLTGLPADERLFYRIRFADLDGRVTGEPAVGTFRSAPTRRRDLRFTWSGDLAGQGWGINPDLGGYRISSSMLDRRPDFFLCSGDTVYADGPLTETVALPDGRTWRNLVTPEKSKVAETLAEYRGQFAYNFLDDNLRRFAAAVPQVNQWDDHEVLNNWYPGEVLDDPRYTEQRVDVLARRARRAFHEWLPIEQTAADGAGRIYRKRSYGPLLDVFVLDMRTYKDPNTADRETGRDGGILGYRQLAWLKAELARSRATWKVIANDLPLGLVVPDGNLIEAVGQGDPGAPLGRELEIGDLLTFIKRRRIRNTVWLTADVHYTAAHHYSPDRASYQDFDPFWEFVSGPLNAGAFGPNQLDGTFGPEAVFVSAPPVANTSPAEGFQFFGEVDIDGHTEVMTVTLRDATGAGLWSTDLQPR